MSTEAVPTQLTRAIRPFLSWALTQAAQIPSTEPLKSCSHLRARRSGSLKFDDPQGLSGWWLDHVCGTVYGAAQ